MGVQRRFRMRSSGEKDLLTEYPSAPPALVASTSSVDGASSRSSAVAPGRPSVRVRTMLVVYDACVRCLCAYARMMPGVHACMCACLCVCVWAGDSREFLLTRGGMSGVCGGGPRLLRGLQLSPAPADAAAHPHIAGEAPHTEPPRRYDATRVAGRADRRAADGAHGEVRLPSGRHCLSKGVPRALPAVSLPHRHARRCCLRGV